GGAPNVLTKIGVIAYGTTHHALTETLERLKNDNIKYLRVRSYPFTSEVEDFIKSCDRVFVIEQNRDAQLRQLIEIDIRGYQNKLFSVLYYGGFPISADFIERELQKALG
ncbi:MAG: 2-oxoacid:acceptor oxidoreductase subunit alpha, partial [Proteobacteria bacterium]|nr:2-oxoacid:acceptor oxidoreductase subunit alpha [Pseudomonadota bacterium]